MKILLAIDGSPCSDAAVEEVGNRPWPEGSVVKVLTTYELPMPPTAAATGSAARFGSESSPRAISRRISRPTTKKKIVIRPSLIQK